MKGLIKMIMKSREEQHIKNKEYIENHKSNVEKCLETYGKELCSLLLHEINKDDTDVLNNDNLINSINSLYRAVSEKVKVHDNSKFSEEEFQPYAKKFFPCQEDIDNKDNVEKEFRLAWEHHYTNNDHHPEYWTRGINGRLVSINMSYASIIEMILDWFAMSIYHKSSPYEWWINNKEDESKYMANNTIYIVDSIMKSYKELDFSKVKI